MQKENTFEAVIATLCLAAILVFVIGIPAYQIAKYRIVKHMRVDAINTGVGQYIINPATNERMFMWVKGNTLVPAKDFGVE